jgi:hypothetical protein
MCERKYRKRFQHRGKAGKSQGKQVEKWKEDFLPEPAYEEKTFPKFIISIDEAFL